MSMDAERRVRSSGARRRALLCLTALAALPPASFAASVPTGVLLRRARHAIAAGDLGTAATALRDARAAEPQTQRGLEAALLLADVEFTRGDAAAADGVLAAAESDFPEGDGAAEAPLARGWLAVARADGAAAGRDFGLVAARSSDPFERELASLGGAWARLVTAGPGEPVPPVLRRLAKKASDPVLRVAAGVTLARAYVARGEPRKALHRLRALRRLVRGTSFADDVELATGLVQLDSGLPSAARRTFENLAASGGAVPVALGLPASGLTLDDLRLPPAAFVARVARLYAARKDRSVGLPTFLAATLDRPARADAAAARALAEAALVAGKEI